MSKATYDLNVILEPNLNEAQLATEKDMIVAQVERAEGTVIDLDEWGAKRLAYPIRKLREGYYLIYRVELVGESPKAIEASLRQRDNVMRVMVVKDRPEWKTLKPKPVKAPVEASA